VEKHFRATHKDTIIKPVEKHTVGGVASRILRSRELQRLVRSEWERQKYFPLQLATGLSRQFASHGLHFFKVNRTYTHVSVARPVFLDLETTPVSEGVKRIIAYINAHPKCMRRQLFEALAPTPRPARTEIKAETPPSTPPAEAGAPAAEPPKAKAPQAEPTPEQTAVIADLHWLVHQGHVIEFADGRVDTAKKPVPKPPKPEKKPAEDKAAADKPAAEGDTTTMMVEPTGEAPMLTEAEIPSEPSPAVEAAAATEPLVEPAAETPAAEPPPEASADEPAAGENQPAS